MVTYLSGERIQGSSTADATPTYSTTFGATTGWSSNDTHVFIDTANNMLEFELDDDNTDEFISYDMGAGNISNTEWVLRCEITFNTWNGQTNDNNNMICIGCYDNASPNGINASGDYLAWGWYMRGTSSTDGHDTKMRSSNNGTVTENEGSNNPFSSSTATATPFYLELKRVSADSLEFRCFSDSSYSTQVGSTLTRSTSSAVTALRYITIQLFCQGTIAGGGYTGYIQNLKFYNAATTTTADEKTAITNVPAGTRYEEVDTRKIFRYDDTGYGSPAVGTAGDIITNSTGTLSQATGSGTIFTSGSELQTGCFDFGSTRVRTGNLQLIPRTNFTVAFWTKADSFSTAGSNSPRYLHGDGNSMIIELGNNASPQIVNFQVATASGTNAKEVAHGMSTGTWYHLAFVYDSSNGDMIIYRDGTAIATDTGNSHSLPIQAHTSWWEFGGGGNEYLDGQMNDFAIWNTKLSSSNITTLVGNKTTTVKRATSVLKTNIVAYWDGSDAIVTVPNAALPSGWKEKGTA
jgi:hypothetical protein